jgi:hypothetical protein
LLADGDRLGQGEPLDGPRMYPMVRTPKPPSEDPQKPASMRDHGLLAGDLGRLRRRARVLASTPLTWPRGQAPPGDLTIAAETYRPPRPARLPARNQHQAGAGLLAAAPWAGGPWAAPVAGQRPVHAPGLIRRAWWPGHWSASSMCVITGRRRTSRRWRVFMFAGNSCRRSPRRSAFRHSPPNLLRPARVSGSSPPNFLRSELGDRARLVDDQPRCPVPAARSSKTSRSA